jgi:hypothetical protein
MSASAGYKNMQIRERNDIDTGRGRARDKSRAV